MTGRHATIPDAQNGFTHLHLTVHRCLTSDEIARVSGCLGYAFTEVLRGDTLSDPEVLLQVFTASGPTVIRYEYDTDSSTRSSPDPQAALEKAAEYIMDGTPIRKTNRQGAGTQGTRLVKGIGACRLAFTLDPAPSPDPEVIPAGDVVHVFPAQPSAVFTMTVSC
jgi:hypothetical protein